MYHRYVRVRMDPGHCGGDLQVLEDGVVLQHSPEETWSSVLGMEPVRVPDIIHWSVLIEHATDYVNMALGVVDDPNQTSCSTIFVNGAAQRSNHTQSWSVDLSYICLSASEGHLSICLLSICPLSRSSSLSLNS